MTISGIRCCPDCGVRELDKYQKKCAECREATRLHHQAIAEHKYRQSDKFYKTRHSDSYRDYQREYMRDYRKGVLRNENQY